MQLVARNLGRRAYDDVWQAMRAFTDSRDDKTTDELWIVEHPHVYTLGQAGKPEHILDAGEVPIVRSDRGGQVTYHGPGQVVIYLLFDIRRLSVNVRELVGGIETAVINLLDEYSLAGNTRQGAPGVYIGEDKIAALGLRIRRGCSYHGLSLNVDPDLTFFSRINPCGYEGLAVTSLAALGVKADAAQVAENMARQLADHFGYDAVSFAAPEKT